MVSAYKIAIMEYSLTRKNTGTLFFTYYDPFLSSKTNSYCISTLLIQNVLFTMRRNYDIKKISAKGGTNIDYYRLSSIFFWDKEKKLKHNLKTNTLTFIVENGLPADLRPTWDKTTDQRIGQLDIRLQKPTREFINTVEEELGIQLRVIQGLRTIAEQNTLYDQGRTTPGNKVTNAKGGQSFHNYGLAVDVVLIKNGEAVWSPVSKDVVDIGTSLGFEWGGNWKSFKDYPHFQMTFGKTIKQLQNK